MLEPIPLAKAGSPSPIRSIDQDRFVPFLVAVNLWPVARTVPTAGDVIAGGTPVPFVESSSRIQSFRFVTPPGASKVRVLEFGYRPISVIDPSLGLNHEAATPRPEILARLT